MSESYEKDHLSKGEVVKSVQIIIDKGKLTKEELQEEITIRSAEILEKLKEEKEKEGKKGKYSFVQAKLNMWDGQKYFFSLFFTYRIIVHGDNSNINSGLANETR